MSMREQQLKDLVIDVIVATTRYPRDILQLESELEAELGIESIKRAEIVGALRDKLGLGGAAVPVHEAPRTVGDLVALVVRLAGAEPSLAAAPIAPAATPAPVATPTAIAPPPVTVTPPTVAKPHAADAAALAIDTIAAVTRYPREVLTPEADLERDLGIESVKRAEIFGALRDRLGLGETQLSLSAPPRTIGDIIALVDQAAAPKSSTPKPAAHRAPSADRPLAGKVAFVTGSGRGLGRVLVKRLAELGVHVIVNSFHSRDDGEATTAEIIAAGGQATHLWGSVANPKHLDAMFDSIRSQFGGLDYFVSNASDGMLAPITEIKPEHWDKAFRTTVVAFHQGALRAAELMQGRGGRILAMSHIGAHHPYPQQGCMGPIKAALEALVRHLAVELGRRGTCVTALSPGAIYGELLTRYPGASHLVPEWERTTPGGRLLDESEAAELAITLLRESTGALNGAVIVADRGYNLALGGMQEAPQREAAEPAPRATVRLAVAS